jgi:3D (Asp-Asp-Asp) domain-containing protein/peptidoglycan hydrolase CwlO-like protein
VAAAAAVVIAAFAPGAVADPRDDADRLRREDAAVAARARSAALELYALDSRLATARTQVSTLRRSVAAIEGRRAEVRREQRAAARTFTGAQRELGKRVRALYEAGGSDPLTTVLASGSLTDAFATVDGLRAAAAQDRAILENARAARVRLAAIGRDLAERGATLRRVEAAAAGRAAMLAAARAQRAAYVDRLAARRRLNSTRIAQFEEVAERARTRTNVLSAPAKPSGAGFGRTVTVTATGYSLTGPTATGLPAGWGVVAVDPSVIPLGTRMTIPGYGTGVAADTGSGIGGARVDLWFPTPAAARLWGRRTVTVSLD